MTVLEIEIEASGLRHRWIAEQLGVSPSHFSRWVSGERRVDAAVHREKLALVLRRKVSDLFDDDGYARPVVGLVSVGPEATGAEVVL